MPNRSFERRTFLKLISAGLGAGILSFPRFALAYSPPSVSSYLDFVLGKPQWILHEDGTFDIYAGSIRLTNCRPSINGQSIFVRNTFMGDSPKGKRIIYEVDGGFVMLDLRTHSNTISIGAEISGMRNAPTRFNPLGEGYLTGANRFFKQGIGTGGQSGIFNIRQSTTKKSTSYPEEDAWSYDSFLMTGLIAENGDTLSIGAYEQNDFIQRSSIYNRPRRKGLNNTRFGKEEVFFEAGFSTENVLLKDEFIKLPDLFIYYGNQPFGTMQNLAWSISEENQARRDTDTNYFWTSSQDFRTSFSYKYLLEQLHILDESKPSIPLHTVIVGNGYCIPGDWLDTNDLWPKSMEDAAREIFKRKYRAGIYVAPFVVHEKCRIFRNHPRWILKDTEGAPIVMDEDAEGKLYALDGSHEDVKDYIAKVFRNFSKMGFTYFELDYLDWGFHDSSDVQRFKKGKTSVQVFRAVMEVIRDEIGAGSLITANRAPFSPLIGYADAVRIDQNHNWRWDDTTMHIIQESYNTQYFNNVFWQNDPDVVFLRNYKSDFTDEEQKSLALWAGFIGGAIGISDNFKLMESEKLQLWRFLEPIKRPQSAMLPFWGNDVKCKVAVRRYKKAKAWGVLILNDTNQTVSEAYQMYDLIGEKEAWVFVWEPGFSLGLGQTTNVSVLLGSHESKLYYITEEKENPSLNLTISGREYTND
ncbi:MAG TPA: alpha-galactosidase [Prolixibacteraceae bacterium]|nr:alpha-galactosidase [Prolixibacteraceae bacterium]